MPSTQNGEASTGFSALVRYRTRRKMEMEVLDIGAGGCLVDARGWSVKPGEKVSVKLPNLAFVAANVVWIENSRAGIAFEEPLYGPTLEHLTS
ncbi:PilZ domain-containing protein [Erythrobacter sp. JK5]|uniref:PilZ domain-containing protein n=1 Tax=Erythrobacter sp. JK5 TaxID=2829500 RepID=UPI001BA59C09|nr:PilZ domain-containing protein [Erythrobacter sp. JK5]QUL37562.1 PilZ domain-containing protein [Erythrobacter sp. JK5]